MWAVRIAGVVVIIVSAVLIIKRICKEIQILISVELVYHRIVILIFFLLSPLGNTKCILKGKNKVSNETKTNIKQFYFLF